MNDAEIRTHIRWLIRRDTPEVLAIENANFDYPNSEEQIIEYMRQKNAIGMAAEYGDRIVGFMLYSLMRTSINVVDFAVCPTWTHRTVGKQMLDKLKGKLSHERRNRIKFHVRESNLAGQLFLRSQGFRAVEVIRGHFEDSGEAAYSMQYFLDPCVPLSVPENAWELSGRFTVTES
jgi:[ribosomal protein S18]-alanine N-acetyltransferase